ncbi:hypothetical protein EJ110_NYTH23358 [Nymphaea thermarum]|nr:hypothetical protein EJ110_NYTH23358 [Nymphaea thermarum]
MRGKPFQLQVFFNDQVGNDFNTLFQTLPPKWPHFVAAVPGSFYSQLFPQDSIHYFNSSFALHWLSKVPDGCCNKGRLHCHGGDAEIVSAYQAQFRADMAAFLAARAGELVAGGLLVLQFVCRHEWMQADAPRYDMWFAYIESILRELVAEGKVKEEDVDSFKLPIFSLEEFKEIVGKNSTFSVPMAEIVDLPHGDEDGKTHEICESDCCCERARDVGIAARAVFGDMVKEEDLDSFQLPIYSPTIEEFKEIVRKNCSFSVSVAQIIDLNDGDDDGETHEICESERARDVGLAARAVFGDMVGNKFGRGTANELFRWFPEAA